MSAPLTHVGWDRGAFAEVVDPAIAVELGVYPPPAKTTTTMCGRRVASSRIDNQSATCPACRAEAAGWARTCLELLAAHPALRRRARDPQALVDALLDDLARFGQPPHDRRLPARRDADPAPSTTVSPAIHPERTFIMRNATLWAVDMGDGTWAMSCRSCRLYYRGPKIQADLLFDTHLCEPVVPLRKPVR